MAGRAVALALAAAAVLAGCETNESGTVVAVEHRPPAEWVQTDCVDRGHRGACTERAERLHRRVEQWFVTVTPCSFERWQTDRAHCVESTHEVGEADYGRAVVGQRFELNPLDVG